MQTPFGKEKYRKRMLLFTMLGCFPTSNGLAAEPGLEEFVSMISGRWDNRVQVRQEMLDEVPKEQTHIRYPMDYIAIDSAGLGGALFAIHNYSTAGFDGSLRRISLHRFDWSADTQEVVHQFLFVLDKDRFGPFPDRLELLQDLSWKNVKTNPGCTMYWRWQGDHFAGSTREGACVTSSFTPEPIRIEADGQLWPGRLVRHDRNLTMEGVEIERQGGSSEEIFCRPQAGFECLTSSR